MSDWHIRVLQGLRVVFIAMVGAAVAFTLWRLGAETTQAPDQLLIVTSTFLVATFSIMIVVYNLQWGHYAKKENPDIKRAAGPRTVLVFWNELLYVLVAFIALGLNGLSAVGLVGWRAAIAFSWVAALLFLVLIALEFHTSIRNINNEQQGT